MAWRTWQAGIVSPNAGAVSQINSPPLMANRRVLWVDPNHPAASDSNPGTQAEAPFATVVHANAVVASTGNGSDYVIMAADMEETLGEVLSKATWVGLGSGESRPKFTAEGSVSYIFDMDESGTEVIDCIFMGTQDDEGPSLVAHIRLASSAHGQLVEGCEFRFEMNTFGYGPFPYYGIMVGTAAVGASNYAEVSNCRFRNLCNNTDDPVIFIDPTNPQSCVAVAYACTGLRVHDCYFDGGDTGYTLGAIYSNVVTSDVAFYNNTFINGADIQMLAVHTGIFSNNTMEDGCIVETLTPITPYPNGICSAEDGGDDILHGPNVFLTGVVYWIDAANPRASDSNSGYERHLPLQSWDIVIARADNCDYAIIEGGTGIGGLGAVYSFASERGITDAVKVYGLGSGTGRPRFEYDNPGAPADVAFLLNGASGTEIHGIIFGLPTASGGGASTWLEFEGFGMTLDGCDFECGVLNPVAVLVGHSAARMTVSDCKFVAVEAGASRGMNFLAEGGPWRSVISNCVFDGATYGFAVAGLAFESASGIEKILALSNTFLFNAQILVPTNQSRVTLAGNISTAGAPVRWS